MLLGFGSAVSAQETVEQRFEFDIPAQAAHTALTEFAEQADLTLVFPDDVVRRKSANALIGKYTLQEGVDILLAGTGLNPAFSNELVLSISADEQPANEGNTMDIKRTPSLLKRLGTTIATAVATLSAAISAAAPDDEGDETRMVEIIIVTAEKREESILDVPLGMTALGGDKLEALGLTNFMDLEQLVPGLQFGDDNEQKGNGTVIRGIGTFRGGTPVSGGSQVNVDRDLAVSVSVDDVFTFASYGLAPQLFDLERVEVLRGPQGTMRGRNAIAGAVNYYTRKPTDEWDALVQAEFTDQFTHRYNVAFGGPLADQLSFRITAGYHEGDGAQENIGLGGDYDAPDEFSYAPQLRFKTDRLDINLRYSRVRDQGAPRTQIRITEPDRTSKCIGAPLGYEGPLEDADGNCIAGSRNRHYLYDQPFPRFQQTVRRVFRASNAGMSRTSSM